MKDKSYKLIEISLFLALIGLLIGSIFIRNSNFYSIINFLAIPIFIWSLLISINKYYELLFSKIKSSILASSDLLDKYIELFNSYNDFIEKEKNPPEKAYCEQLKISEITKQLQNELKFSDKYIKSIKVKKNICYWLMILPITTIFLLLGLSSIILFPAIEISFINLLSLILLVGDWLFVDQLVSYSYNKFCGKLCEMKEHLDKEENQ